MIAEAFRGLWLAIRLLWRAFVLVALAARHDHHRRISLISRSPRRRYNALLTAEKYGRLYHQRLKEWTT